MSTPELLATAVRELALARDLATVISIVRREARRVSGADGVTFVLRDGAYCHYVDEDAIAPLWKGRRFPMSECISGWVRPEYRAVQFILLMLAIESDHVFALPGDRRDGAERRIQQWISCRRGARWPVRSFCPRLPRSRATKARVP